MVPLLHLLIPFYKNYNMFEVKIKCTAFPHTITKGKAHWQNESSANGLSVIHG